MLNNNNYFNYNLDLLLNFTEILQNGNGTIYTRKR